ncbi:DoxX family membrane protein [Stackebrandtia nassauensis]|uniref:DoxX family protein n=1 Tax=Stackebrandtia nassauensis (strain DSM 44728 / CIP 108903 / NRRL B-16338 / NBRC 102104 / LLR-40K-21) TaxID=446470 RepID=D3PVI6_STANL|nr:DoxX family membrane protein [Stackebrandtia nassauensis]ADD43100.1 DoxX family protein [Stackebrandtia nassauensis DSM 44728]
MTTHQRPRHEVPVDESVPDPSTHHGRRVWAVARIGVGWIFLWAFLDKTFGLGYATPPDHSWLNGGRPTQGFLANSASGPFKGFYTSIAGAAWADWLFMLGLAGIGIAMILGIGMRIAAIAAAIQLVLMWSVALPPANNPLIDDHIIMAILVIGLAYANAGDTWGFGKPWSRTGLVQSWPVLR